MEFQEIHKTAKNSKWLSLLSGFIGATLPSLGVLYAMTQVPAEQFEFPHFNFFLGMFIMGAMGAFVVAISGERNAYKALPLGGGAPSLLNTAGTVAAVQGGATATSFTEHIGAAFVSVIMLVSPNAQAQPTLNQKVITQDSIQIIAVVPPPHHQPPPIRFKKAPPQHMPPPIFMVVGTNNYILKDTLKIKIPKVDSIYIGNMEKYVKYSLPSKDTVYLTITPKKEVAKSKRHFVKGLFAMQQQISNKLDHKHEFNVEIR